MMTHACTLRITGLELGVHLGWPAREQEQEQIVLLDLEICFPQPPKACQTDRLADTVCYATLISALRESMVRRKFRLVEHLSFEIYQFIKPLLPAHTGLTVRIIKHPDIEGLTGAVRFIYGDVD